MDALVAEAIINAAKGAGYETEPMPETLIEKITRGEYWVVEAQKAVDKGMNSPVVLEILAMANGEVKPPPVTEAKPIAEAPPPEPEPEPVVEEPVVEETTPEPAPEAESSVAEQQPEAPEETVTEVPAPTPEPVTAHTPATVMSEGTGSGSSVAVQENLPIPPHMEAEPPMLPADLTALDDLSLRKLYGQMNAYLARVDYLAIIEKVALDKSAIMAQASYDVARAAAPKVDGEGKRRLAEDVDIDVRANTSYKEWTEKRQQHNERYVELNGLRGIYAQYLSTISREFSMRSEEMGRAK